MDARNLIWIIPVTAIMFFIVGISFVDYDFNITMDDNTRIAVESLNESLGSVNNIANYEKVIECQDELIKTNDESHEVRVEIYQVMKLLDECERQRNDLEDITYINADRNGKNWRYIDFNGVVGCNVMINGTIHKDVDCPEWMLK